MTRKKTNEEFVKEVYSLVSDEYVFLKEYQGAKIKIFCKHNKCNYEWEITPDNFLNGGRCPQCKKINISNANSKTNEIFLKQVYDLVGEEYNFLQKYNGSNTNIRCKHNVCGYEWDVKPSKFLMGRRCPKCAGNIKKNTRQFKQEVYELTKDEYAVLGKYINTGTKIKIRHNECGYEWDISPNSFLRGTRCPKCQHRSYKKTSEEFRQEVYELVGDEYFVIGEYVNKGVKVKIQHSFCDYEYYISPNGFLNGSRCPKCAESKGEQQTRQYLESLNIDFKQEYSFDGLVGVGGQPLRFDFAIFNNTDNLELLIEYDGEFHYTDIYKDGSLKIQQIHDERKNQYCKENNIPLLRIPYWEFENIEEILFEKLNELEVKIA